MSLLALLISLSLVVPMGSKVLCFSPDTGHVTVEFPHSKTEHKEKLETRGIVVFAAVCEHANCTDIPLGNGVVAILNKVDQFSKAIDFLKIKFETAKVIFYSADITKLLSQSQLIRVAKLPASASHFLYMLVRTIVLLN